ncbi:MAG TPA: AAA family ATPase, partial [Nitriliruptorales bacterium]|nr:AAA family ATPase [Nitriliruptorales bacterium]
GHRLPTPPLRHPRPVWHAPGADARRDVALTELFGEEELVGEVRGVHYADRATGFGVIELATDPRREGGGARCAGPLADLVKGQTVRLVGSWGDHPTYGATFEAAYYEQTVPTTVAGLRAFLLSGRFPGVGPATVDLILTAFGSTSGWVIEREPERLRTEAGLRPDLAALVHERWQQGKALAELVRLLEPAGVPYDVVRSVFARFGADAAAVARDDPFALLEAERCRFAHADALARHLGVDLLDPRRLAAAAVAAHAGARRRDGHQYLTRAQCVEEAARLLRLDAVAAADGVAGALSDGRLVTDSVAVDGEVPIEAVYTPCGLAAERELVEDIARLLATDRSRLVPHAGDLRPSAQLTSGQAAALRLAFASPVTIVTGGPGTGKTRSVQEVVLAAEAAGLNVALCAPTGRAAKRLEELVGRAATTVHRLLEARPVTQEGRRTGGFAFRYGRVERLPHDLVVCDEVSMCDTWLAASLVGAVDDGAHLVLVGDPDQLPPVGTGDVLRDLLRSGAVPCTRLTEIHRQAAASRIVSLANEVNAGRLGPVKGVDGDVIWAEEPVRSRIVPRVVEAVANRAPGYFGVAVADIQVVAPVYRGEAGVDALNAALKAALNPGRGPRVAGFHVGDRVMQTRNDAELDVSNGDVGHVVDVDPSHGELRVGFPRGEVTYASDQARDLTLAWAVTVHKSQGGEWPVVVFVCDRSHRGMLWRNLAYTAITRAQRALVGVGQVAALAHAAGHDRPRDRQTLLAARLLSTVAVMG